MCEIDAHIVRLLFEVAVVVGSFGALRMWSGVRRGKVGVVLRDWLLYVGGALPIVWGAAHMVPTRRVVAGFGEISRDSRLVLTMEWIAEGILLMFTGVLVVVMTARFGAGAAATQTAAVLAASMLLVLAVVSALTGGRVDFVMYRLCAPIFVASAVVMLAGALL